MPCVAHRVYHWSRSALDRDDRLTDRPLGRCLTRFRVLSVKQDRAGRAIADSATKLRPCIPSTSRKTHSSGVFAWRSATSTSAPLMVNFMRIDPSFAANMMNLPRQILMTGAHRARWSENRPAKWTTATSCRLHVWLCARRCAYRPIHVHAPRGLVSVCIHRPRAGVFRACESHAMPKAKSASLTLARLTVATPDQVVIVERSPHQILVIESNTPSTKVPERTVRTEGGQRGGCCSAGD